MIFPFAIIIGIYAYILFFLGVFGLLYPSLIYLTTIMVFVAVFIASRKIHTRFLVQVGASEKLFLLLLLGLMIVNLIGALGPELAFDALWYHLTLPKLYLIQHTVFYIPGGLLYYSTMPKLIEMFYVAGLAIQGSVGAKIIHWFFGVLCLIALYGVARQFLSRHFALLVLAVFYANLVVSWESITAYVDLGRTLYEILAFYAFFLWWKKSTVTLLLLLALMVGFAMTTKLLAFGSLVIFALLIIITGISQRKKLRQVCISLVSVICLSLMIPLPWLIFSYLHTGNFIYPFFSSRYNVSLPLSLINPFHFIREIISIFTHASDPISPIYLIVVPLLIVVYPSMKKKNHLLVWYSTLAIIIWYLTPHTGGGRFLLPYLPILSILVVVVVEHMRSLTKYLTGLIIMIALLTIVYRGVANSKFIPVLLGKQTADTFLTQHLNFDFGDFYDTDGYFRKTIRPNDRVLLYGFHNLYYVNFPFIHESWVKKGDMFTYIAVQNGILPKRFNNFIKVHTNDKTHVTVYYGGGKQWIY